MKSANLHLAEIILLTIENKPVIHNHFSAEINAEYENLENRGCIY